MNQRTIASLLLTAAMLLGPAKPQASKPSVETRQTASNYYAYPYPELPLPALTPSPEGYEPFHMEHYGRHGSRWHIGEWVYTQPIALLRPAERQGKLTPRGKELMAQLRDIEIASRGRDGELTPLGARQHRGIARRMTRNFPQIFKGNARIDAKSTDVVRCILSMDNELQELAAFNPGLDITSDASKSTVRYLNFTDTLANRLFHEARRHALAPVEDSTDYIAFAGQLITDPKFIADSIEAKELYRSLFRIASNAQSHDDQTAPYDLFTPRQLHDRWAAENAGWFLEFGNNSLTRNTGPMRQRYLMRNWIESADTSIMRSGPSANLRFGHEVVVLPMAMLMDLDGLGKQIDDMSQVEKQWRAYEIFPMASNIQMIFYRPAGKPYTPDDVLVKVMLNEREVSLPATPVSGPYYRWTDIRNAYLDRLGPDGGIFPAPEPYIP